jgi:hypothetical protein
MTLHPSRQFISTHIFDNPPCRCKKKKNRSGIRGRGGESLKTGRLSINGHCDKNGDCFVARCAVLAALACNG